MMIVILIVHILVNRYRLRFKQRKVAS